MKVRLEESVESDGSDANNVSKKSLPDYSVYSFYLAEGQPVKILLIEAKTSASVCDHSICQLMGYYMATETTYIIGGHYFPPLAILLTEKAARLVYFPYLCENCPCMDAAVSSEILLANGNKNPHMVLF